MTDETTPQDDAAMPPASTGSVDILTRLADHHTVTMWDVDDAAAEIARLRDVMYRIVDEDCTVAIQNGRVYADGEPLFSVPCSRTSERTPATHATPGDGTEQRKRTDPVAWLVEGCEYDTGCEFQYVALLKEQAEAAAAEGATVTPLNVSQQSRLWIAAAEYTGGISSAGESKPTLTPEEREAVEIAVEYVGSAYQVEHHAAVLRGLLERTM